MGGVFIFLAFASIQYPDTLIRRPHPVFWRIFMGALSLYILFLTYLLF
jgi:phosphatidylserine synthase 2